MRTFKKYLSVVLVFLLVFNSQFLMYADIEESQRGNLSKDDAIITLTEKENDKEAKKQSITFNTEVDTESFFESFPESIELEKFLGSSGEITSNKNEAPILTIDRDWKDDILRTSLYSKAYLDWRPYRTLISKSKNGRIANKGTYTPIELSDLSFNVDIVAEGDIVSRSGTTIATKQAAFSTTRALEDSRYTTMETVFASEGFRGEANPDWNLFDNRFGKPQDFNPVLPANRVFTDGLITYNLQPYDELNGIMLSGDDAALDEATITLKTPQAFSSLSFLTIGTGLKVELDIEFDDGTRLYGQPFEFSGLISYPQVGGPQYSNFFNRGVSHLLVARNEFEYSSPYKRDLLGKSNNTVVFPDIDRSADDWINPEVDGAYFHTLYPEFYDLEGALKYKKLKSIKIKNPQFEASNPYNEYNNVVILAVSGNPVTKINPPAINSPSSQDIYANRMRITWEEMDYYEGFEIDVATDASFNNKISQYNNQFIDPIDNSYTLTGLDSNTQYYIRMRGKTGTMTSASSATMMARTETGLYSITYDGNGMTSGSVPVDASKYGENSHAYILDENPNPPVITTGGSYEFSGWNTKADGSGDYYYFGDEIDIDAENITLYAQYALIGKPKGTGTLEDPYIIATSDNLLWVSANSNGVANAFDGEYFKQVRNIDLAGIDWVPIGSFVDSVNNGYNVGEYMSTENSFRGTYDGQNYKIKNLTIDKTLNESDYAIEYFTKSGNWPSRGESVKLAIGLFGATYKADIKNIVLEGVNIDVTINDDISETGRREAVGGLIGYAHETTVTACTIDSDSIIDVNAPAFTSVGGLIGWYYTTETTSNNEFYLTQLGNSASVTLTEQSGSYAEGGEPWTEEMSHVGGILGFNNNYGSSRKVSITNSYNKGDVVLNLNATYSEISNEKFGRNYAIYNDTTVGIPDYSFNIGDIHINYSGSINLNARPDHYINAYKIPGVAAFGLEDTLYMNGSLVDSYISSSLVVSEADLKDKDFMINYGYDEDIWLLSDGAFPIYQTQVSGLTGINLPLEEKNITIEMGSTKQLNPYAEPSFLTTSYAYKSENEFVATVDENGEILAISPGTTKIKVVSQPDEFVTYAFVTVSGTQVTKVELDKNSVTLLEGEMVNLNANVLPANATKKTVSWYSSNPGVATVNSSGLVNANNPGVAVIRVTTDDHSYSDYCVVTVTPVLISDFTLSKTEIEFTKELGNNPKTTVVASNFISAIPGRQPSITDLDWTSDDNSIVTVSNYGVIYAHDIGSTTIRAKARDGSNVEKTISVTVNGVGVSGVVAVNQDEKNLEAELGQIIPLAVNVLPENALDHRVRWSTSDVNVVEVDKNGWIKAVALGNAQITATTVDGGYSETFNIEVKITERKITIANKGKFFKIANTKQRQIEVEVLPLSATSPEFTYSSSDESVASIDENGVLTALSNGTTVVQVRTVNRGISDQALLKVVDYKEGVIRVIDEETNESISGANVEIEGDIYTTDDNGKIDVIYTRDSSGYLFGVTKEGYQKKEKPLDVLDCGYYTMFLSEDTGVPYVMYTGIEIENKVIDAADDEAVLDYVDKNRVIARINWNGKNHGDVFVTNGSKRERLAKDPYSRYRTAFKSFYESLYLTDSVKPDSEDEKTENIDKSFLIKFTPNETVREDYSKKINWKYIKGDLSFNGLGMDNANVDFTATGQEEMFKTGFEMELPDCLPIQIEIEDDRIYMAVVYDASFTKEDGESFKKDPGASEYAMAIKESIQQGKKTPELEDLTAPPSSKLEKRIETSIELMAYMEAQVVEKTKIVDMNTITQEEAYSIGIGNDAYYYLKANNPLVPVKTGELEVTSSGFAVTASGDIIYGQQFTVFIFPAYIEMRIGAELEVLNNFTFVDNVVEYDGSTTLTPRMGAYAAVGIGGVLSVGPDLEGSLPIEFTYPEPTQMTVDLIIDFAVRIQLLFLDERFTMYDKEWNLVDETLVSASSNLNSEIWGNVDQFAVYNLGNGFNLALNNMSMSERNYTAYNDNNSGITLENMIGNRYKYNFDVTSGYYNMDPKIVELSNGKLLMVWLDDNLGRNLMNRTQLYYSYFSGNTWSNPQSVDNDQTIDGKFDLVTDGNIAYIVYENGDCALEYNELNPTDKNNSTVSDLVGNMNIDYITFNGSNNQMSAPVTLNTENLLDATAEYLPKIAFNQEEKTATWISNDENDIFGLMGTTSIKESVIRSTNRAEETIFSTTKKVMDIDTIYKGGNLITVFLSDEDNAYETFTDRSIHIVNEDGTSTKLVEGKNIENPRLALIGEKVSLYWYEDGDIKYREDIYSDYTDIVPRSKSGLPFTSKFEIVEGHGKYALIYEVGDFKVSETDSNVYEQIRELYYVNYNKDANSFAGYTANLSKNGENITNFNGVIGQDGYLYIATNEEISFVQGEEKYYAGDLNLLKVKPSVDLEVQNGDIIVDESGVIAGYSTNMSMYVKNIGEIAARGIVLELLDESNNIIDTQTMENVMILPEDDYYRIVFSYDVPSPLTEHKLKVKVSSINEVDGDNTNNYGEIVLGGIDLKTEAVKLKEMASSYYINGAIINTTYRNATGIKVNLYETDNDKKITGNAIKTISIGDMEPYGEGGFEIELEKQLVDFAGSYGKYYIVEVEANEHENRLVNNYATFYIQNERQSLMPYDVSLTEMRDIGEDRIYNVNVSNNYNEDNGGSLLLKAIDDQGNVIHQEEKDIDVNGNESKYLQFAIEPALANAASIVVALVTSSDLSGLNVGGQVYYSNVAVETTADLTLSDNNNLLNLEVVDNENLITFDKDVQNYSFEFNTGDIFKWKFSAEDSRSLIKFYYPNGEIYYAASDDITEEIEPQHGIMTVEIEAENGDKRTYYIETIDIAYINSTSLKAIDVENHIVTPDPEEGVKEFLVEKTTQETLEVSVEPINENATMFYNEQQISSGTPLELTALYGMNDYVITVVSSTGEFTDKTKLSIYRQTPETRLDTLQVENGELDKDFDPDTEEYTVTLIGEKQLEISIDMDKYTSIKQSGDDLSTENVNVIDYDIDDPVVEIDIVSEDELHNRTYTLNINYIDTNPDLKTLEIDGLDLIPVFDKDTLSYSTSMSLESTVLLTLQSEHPNATIEFDGEEIDQTQDIELELEDGLNEYEIKVTAESGIETKTYELTVDKADSNSVPNDIDILNGLMNTDFDKDVHSYDVNLFNTKTAQIKVDIDEYDSVTINGTSIDASQIYLYEMNNFEETINIVIVSEDLSNQSEYEFNIRYYTENTKLVKMSSLGLKLSPEFESDTLEYEFNNTTVNWINLNLEPRNINAQVKVDGEIVEWENGVILTLDLYENQFDIEVSFGAEKRNYILNIFKIFVPEPEPEPEEKEPIVEVNGEKEPLVEAEKETEEETNESSIKVTINEDLVKKHLDDQDEKKKITISLLEKADSISSVLTAKTIKEMEEVSAKLVVDTPIGGCLVDAKEFNIPKITQEIGEDIPLKDIEISVKINRLSTAKKIFIDEVLNKASLDMLSEPVEFEITARHNDKVVTVTKFTKFMQKKIEITKEEAEKLKTAVVLEEDGTLRSVPTKVEYIDGKYYAIINSLTNSTYLLIDNTVEFNDVDGRWSQGYIEDLASRRILEGNGEGAFEPTRNMTRAEYVACVVRAVGLPLETGVSDFEDVDLEKWYASLIHAAYDNNLVFGQGNKLFNPNQLITREEAMVIISRALIYTDINVEADLGILDDFPDREMVSSWSEDEISILLEHEIVSGRNGNLLAPKELISREEAVALICKYLEVTGLID